jgi:L-lactate dehydrogenase
MKVAIVGAGSVGATVAYACLLRGAADELVLYDLDAAKADAQALDLAQGVQFAQMARVTHGSELGVCAESDVIVITAGARQKPGQTRLDLAEANARMCHTLVPELVAGSPNALLLVVTNPVDVVVRAALRASGLPPARVVGTGTVLDSSRLREVLARRCGVAVQNVHAYVLGEHGDSEVAIWSNVTIGGVPLARWGPSLGGMPGEDERRAMLEEVRQAADRIIAGKGATNFAIGVVAARVVEAVTRNERRVLPVTSFLEGYLGIGDVCMSVPAIVGREGVAAHIPIPVDDAELVALTASAACIRDACVRAGA